MLQVEGSDLPKAMLSVKGGSEPTAVNTSAAVTVTTPLAEPSWVRGDRDHDRDHTTHVP